MKRPKNFIDLEDSDFWKESCYELSICRMLIHHVISFRSSPPIDQNIHIKSCYPLSICHIFFEHVIYCKSLLLIKPNILIESWYELSLPRMYTDHVIIFKSLHPIEQHIPLESCSELFIRYMFLNQPITSNLFSEVSEICDYNLLWTIHLRVFINHVINFKSSLKTKQNIRFESFSQSFIRYMAIDHPITSNLLYEVSPIFE